MNQKDFALSIAKEAGEIIRRNFVSGMSKEWKSDLTPVTETDYRINTLLIERVQKDYPNYGVLGEEESFNEKAQNLWVCDPVDGTIPFSHGVPICTFGLALVKDGEVVLGLIYDPFMDNLLYAEKGAGTMLNGKRVSVSDKSNTDKSLLELTNWARAPYYMPNLMDLLEKDGAITTHYCSILYFCALVASGEYLGDIYAGDLPHDVAAAKVIVEEAGGKVTDLFGEEQRYDQKIKGAIISNGKVHEYLMGKVKESLKSSKN